MRWQLLFIFFFFFNDTATTEIYTLSLHDALPILMVGLIGETCSREALEDRDRRVGRRNQRVTRDHQRLLESKLPRDRKSTRLNSSHLVISYAVFCLKKKKHHQY